MTEEIPEKFEPFEKWKSAWVPYPMYVSLTEAHKRVVEAGRTLAEVMPQCQVIGQTMHVEKEIPSAVWSSEGWDIVPEENRVGQPRYAEHLQFQVQVFEADLERALGHGTPGPTPPRAVLPSEPEPRGGALAVESVEHPGLPSRWTLRTVEGVAWQAVSPAGLYGPLQPEIGLAVGDAWSHAWKSVWVLHSTNATNTDPSDSAGEPSV